MKKNNISLVNYTIMYSIAEETHHKTHLIEFKYQLKGIVVCIRT
jgi:hypothetical protein